MNMLFEGLKEKGALVIVPSSAVDTMNLGGLSGMVSLAKNQIEGTIRRYLIVKKAQFAIRIQRTALLFRHFCYCEKCQ